MHCTGCKSSYTVQPLPVSSVTTEDQSNCMAEATCTSLRLPLFDNAGTQRHCGSMLSCPANDLKSHRPPSRHTGQASMSAARPPHTMEDGRSLNYQQGKQLLRTSCHQYMVPILRINNGDMGTRTRCDKRLLFNMPILELS